MKRTKLTAEEKKKKQDNAKVLRILAKINKTLQKKAHLLILPQRRVDPPTFVNKDIVFIGITPNTQRNSEAT